MSEAVSSSQTSRRTVIRTAALTGIAASISYASTQSLAVENNSMFPDIFHYPDLEGPSLALWGSSTFEGARATEGVPSGFDAKIATLLTQYVGLPILNFGRGGETSTSISARRGVKKYTYAPVLPDDMLPSSGSISVALERGNSIKWDSTAYIPGFIQDIPVVLKANGTEGSYSLTRLVEGKKRYCPTGTGANFIASYQEMLARSSHHVIQIGRNNIQDTERIKEDTVSCFELAPQRSAVMGHFPRKDEAQDSTGYKDTIAYNDWAKDTYKKLYIDVMYWLREVSQQSWLRYGDLAGSGVWNSEEDRKDYDEGKVPRSLYASDGLHLNGWGYIVLARAIENKVRELGWV